MSQDLLAQIAELERTARLYNVLKDDKNMLDVYRTKDEGLSTTRTQLDRQLRAPAAHQALEELGQQQGTIRLSVMSMSRGAADLGDLTQRFGELTALAAKVREQSNAQIDAEVTALELRTQAARRRMLWQSALLVPLLLTAIIAVTFAVGRPPSGAGPGHQRAGQRDAVEPDRRLRSAGSGAGRPAARMAAWAPARSGAGAQSIFAAHVARAQDSACEHSRGNGAVDGWGRRRARRQST